MQSIIRVNPEMYLLPRASISLSVDLLSLHDNAQVVTMYVAYSKHKTSRSDDSWEKQAQEEEEKEKEAAELFEDEYLSHPGRRRHLFLCSEPHYTASHPHPSWTPSGAADSPSLLFSHTRLITLVRIQRCFTVGFHMGSTIPVRKISRREFQGWSRPLNCHPFGWHLLMVGSSLSSFIHLVTHQIQTEDPLCTFGNLTHSPQDGQIGEQTSVVASSRGLSMSL